MGHRLRTKLSHPRSTGLDDFELGVVCVAQAQGTALVGVATEVALRASSKNFVWEFVIQAIYRIRCCGYYSGFFYPQFRVMSQMLPNSYPSRGS